MSRKKPKLPKRQCTATAQTTGQRCRAPSVKERNVCRKHGGMAGAPKRNHNARKHGLYSNRIHDPEEKAVFDAQLIEPTTLEEELALLRAKMVRLERFERVASQLSDHPDTPVIEETRTTIDLEGQGSGRGGDEGAKLSDAERRTVRSMGLGAIHELRLKLAARINSIIETIEKIKTGALSPVSLQIGPPTVGGLSIDSDYDELAVAVKTEVREMLALLPAAKAATLLRELAKENRKTR